MEDQDDDPKSPEEQYLLISVCSFAIESEVEKLRGHLSGNKPMSKKELDASLVNIDNFVEKNKDVSTLAIRAVVPLDSDSLSRIEIEAKKIIRKAGGESDEEDTPPPATPSTKKKGKPGPKGKGKSSKSTSNGQDRPASQAGPRDDDKEDDNDGISLTDFGEGNDDESPAGDAVVVKKWPMPKVYIDREDQLDIFEEQAEESRELVLSAREDLHSGKRGRFAVNLYLVPCPSPLEERRLNTLQLCTKGLSGVEVIRKLDQTEDYLVFLFDTNQDVLESVQQKNSQASSRIVRGGSNAARINRLEASINPIAASDDMYLAGVRAFGEAVESGIVTVHPRDDGSGEDYTDEDIVEHLKISDEMKDFLHYIMYLKSAYIAFHSVPPLELIESAGFPKKYRNDIKDLYNRLCCDNGSIEDCTESLTFVLALTRYLGTFSTAGVITDNERFVAQMFIHLKTAMERHPSVWSDHVDPFYVANLEGVRAATCTLQQGTMHADSNKEDELEISRHFSRAGKDASAAEKDRRVAVNTVLYMACGNQIHKLLAQDHRFKEAEAFRSVVMRCSVNALKQYGRGFGISRFFESGTSTIPTKMLGHIEMDIYRVSAKNIGAFERDRLLAYNLDESEEATEKKFTIASESATFAVDILVDGDVSDDETSD